MLLVFPLETKPDWRRPPLVTLLLILVNCLVWFGPQRADQRALDRAGAYYAQSGLAAIELPHYLGWLERQNDADHRGVAQQLRHADPADPDDAGLLLTRLEMESRFRAELDAGRLLRSDDPDHARWRELRQRLVELRGNEFTRRWSQRPAEWRLDTLLSATFLHGSTMHLVGNMIFLFAFGYTLEMALGGPLLLLCYLLAGMGGELGDLLARWGSIVPGLGASGAVSGLMAMYVVLYGRRRIRFFFHLLFYFSVTRAPAIVLLPLWMGFELYAHFAEAGSGIANMAHFGGLASGALLMAGLRRLRPTVQAPLRPEAVPDPFELRRAEAHRLLEAARYDDARKLWGELSAERPRDAAAVLAFHNLARLRPDTPDFHLAALRLFGLPDNAVTPAQLCRAVDDYLQLARPRPLLKPEAAARLALRLARLGETGPARGLLDLAARLGAGSPPPASDAPARLAIVSALLRSGRPAEAREAAAALAERHPASQENRLALDLLKGAGLA
ncbi:rhomboid family intramembrane serine protease [Derxia lacustris]|uniref:rhomboid family intramembrane serine protease n=1 Tax=Derxia lacustris TaxID=764842 RepID=UPI000A171A59|nr:rhomboid family intramembrane serine protease [Derxia lacustris]